MGQSIHECQDDPRNEIIRIGNGIARMRRLYQSADLWGVTPDGTLWVARGRENLVDRVSA